MEGYLWCVGAVGAPITSPTAQPGGTRDRDGEREKAKEREREKAKGMAVSEVGRMRDLRKGEEGAGAEAVAAAAMGVETGILLEEVKGILHSDSDLQYV